jgi:hypothetical protein
MKEYPTLPSPYLGYLFCVVFIGYEFLLPDVSNELAIRLAIALFGWVYYLYIVYTIHEVVEIRYTHRYDVSPTKATFLHLVPIYNFYWLYKWPTKLFDYITNREERGFFNQQMVVALILGGPLLSRFDFAVGYACTTTGLLLLINGMKELIQMPDPDAKPLIYTRA